MFDDKTAAIAPVTNTTTASKEDTNIKSKNGYRIYNYFKNNMSSFLAFVSALIAAISVMLNFLGYITTKAYLSYFEVDPNIRVESMNLLYLFAIGLTLIIVQCLSQSFLSSTFDTYRPYKQRFLLLKYSLKNIKKEWNLNHSNIRLIVRSLNRIHITDKNKKEFDYIKNMSDKLKYNEQKVFTDYLKIKKVVRKQMLRNYTLICMSCIVAWLALFFVFSVFLSISAVDTKSSLFFTSFISLILVLISVLENWFFSCVLFIDRKQIKKDALTDKADRVLSYEDFPETPLETMLFGKPRNMLSDSNITKCLGTTIFVLFLLFILSPWCVRESAKNQKEFFVVNENDIVYAVIYNDGEKMVLEKAEIVENNLTIDSKEQKVIDVIGITTKKCTFENVVINRTEKVDYEDIDAPQRVSTDEYERFKNHIFRVQRL